ncbi:MAG: hydantoinase/oxoprolinase family protein [Gammaproteobacteria bacterium]|nr:hydantoinase/oxoprolinase family protein [Gammaproteobacteria bacterium]
MTRYALAIDIGGTFTDAVLISDDGRGWTDKTLSTHHDLLEGFFKAADMVLDKAGIKLDQVNDVVTHATTVVTNILIERKGSPTGLITTEGFRDVLYIRDEHRYDMFDPQIEYPEPLITRDYTWGIDERIYADGSVGKEIDPDAVAKIASDLVAKNVSTIAVCFLNSYRNPDNERRFRDILHEIAPDLFITLSSDVAPQMREYLRTSTTAINAYTVPITRPYLNALIEKLQQQGVDHEPLIMLSNGGVVGARTAGTYPVRMIESGPAAGALVAGFIARKHGIENLISFDMGGTTAKACIVQGGEPLVIGDFEVDRRYRFKPGSGMPITVPSIDMIEIGAGGGSIARIDSLGLLKVGPDSAGSSPGPACYGQGGSHACVTDADVVLGILDPLNFLGGDMALDGDAAFAAVKKLADVLETSVDDAAHGIFSVVGESMAAAARAHATDRGVNYRGLPMLAFGGAGPVHACYVAERLDSTQVIYPAMASVLSAFGTLVTPARLDLARSGLCRLSDIDWQNVEPLIAEMLDEGTRALIEAGLDESAAAFEFAADMRYVGQQNEVPVPLAGDPRQAENQDDLRERFNEIYQKLYGLRLDDMDIEVVSWRVTAHGGEAQRQVNVSLANEEGKPKSRRNVYIENRHVETPVYDRSTLALGQQIDGPIIIEERETTVFILPGWSLTVRDDGSLIANRQD